MEDTVYIVYYRRDGSQGVAQVEPGLAVKTARYYRGLGWKVKVAPTYASYRQELEDYERQRRMEIRNMKEVVLHG